MSIFKRLKAVGTFISILLVILLAVAMFSFLTWITPFVIVSLLVYFYLTEPDKEEDPEP